MLKLRKPQSDALVSAKSAFLESVYRLLVVLPTGMGKTPVFANIRMHFGFKRRILVLVHMEELATQAAGKIRAWNPNERIGIEMAGQFSSPRDTFVVASVPTLSRKNSPRLAQFDPNEFDCVICDEAHHSISPSWKRVLRHFGFDEDGGSKFGILLYGTTATPDRGDKQAMGQIYDKIVYQYSMVDAVRDGWLVEPRGYRVSTGVSLDDVKVRAGEWDQGVNLRASSTY